MEKIYVLHLLRIEERTEESFIEELRLENFKYNREITLERYKERICSFNQLLSKFKLDMFEDNAYFLDFSDAEYCARTNMTDINEAGVYNYVCITSSIIGSMYGACEPSELHLYKYNREKDEYEDVNSKEDVYKFIEKELGVIPSE